MAAHRIDQLGGDPNPIAGAADAAFEDIADPEFAGDPGDFDGRSLVGERRAAGDDEEGAIARQRGDDVLDDAAGKDGTIKHVMSGVNPQGCQVYSFKIPSPEELDHDFLWRCMKYVPERGRIGIFNRSYYEETLVVRVHPEFLDKQTLPPELVTKNIWKERFQDIRNFERYLRRNGVVVRKFFLHVSKGEQKGRFLERLENPEKNWKFSANDIKERAYWGDYMTAYEDMIRHTSTPEAPWYVVPADNTWFTRIVVAAAVIETLDALKLHYPKVSKEKLKDLAAAQRVLIGHTE